MDKTITAIIPVKGNSTRLPNKNILPFADSNLLIHKIRQLKQVEGITEIIVSSDSLFLRFFSCIMLSDYFGMSRLSSELIWSELQINFFNK